MKEQKPGIVDLHVHLFPERMFLAIWDFFESSGWRVHHETVDQIAATLTAHGVGCAAGLAYPHKPGVAEPLNRFMESLRETHPLFRPFACVHPDDDDFGTYVKHALASPGLYGFKFQPLVQKFDVNDPRLDPLYEGCLERDFPITMHIGTGPHANDFVGPKHFRKLMQRFPALRICVPHMGVPDFDAFLDMLDDHPNMFLDTTMINVPTYLFDTSFQGDRETLLRHADRICFGSDWPNVPYAYQDALDSVDRFGFSERQKSRVLRDNALRFLQLESCP